MVRFPNFSAIASDLGRIFLFMGLVSYLPLLVGLFYGEYGILLPMISAPVAFTALGLLLLRIRRPCPAGLQPVYR